MTLRSLAMRPWIPLLLLSLAGPAESAEAPATIPALPSRQAPRLVVTPDGRHFARSDGRSFFWVGDTAWPLLHHATRSEIGAYLDDRAKKRFSVIQVCLVPEMGGLDRPNREGQVPFLGGDPMKPNPGWFDLADWFVKMAGDMGFQVALSPVWEGYVAGTPAPPLFTPAAAESYGRWLGERFRRRPNVIWMLGGERDFTLGFATWQSLAAGLKAGSGEPSPVITCQPGAGETAGSSLHGQPWLTFDTVPGHPAIHAGARAMLGLEPAKPFVSATSTSEGAPAPSGKSEARITADEVRRDWYGALFSGAAGINYSAQEVRLVWAPELEPSAKSGTAASPVAQMHWTNALAYPGSAQLKLLRALTESRPWHLIVSDPALVVAPKSEGLNSIASLRATDGSTALCYLPNGGEVVVDLGRLAGASISGTWWSPSSGGTSGAGRFERAGNRVFKAPTSGPGQDWVLVLDDVSRGFGPAGQRPPRARPTRN